MTRTPRNPPSSPLDIETPREPPHEAPAAEYALWKSREPPPRRKSAFVVEPVTRNTCECPLVDGPVGGVIVEHRESCEYSPYFAQRVDEARAQARYDADEPKGGGDPTNPQHPDRGDHAIGHPGYFDSQEETVRENSEADKP